MSDSVELISQCRLCGNDNLEIVYDLRNIAFSGSFPANPNSATFYGALTLLRCQENLQGCGLIQLSNNFKTESMYGENYGYRSGLNPSMISHLHDLYIYGLQFISLTTGDLVIDIAGNDGTFLKNFDTNFHLLSVDPTASKFSEFYPPHIDWIANFFSHQIVASKYHKKAKFISSFSVLYDLENPQKFVNDISTFLDSDGIWISEQSYLPTMIENNSFDTICHEHLLYLTVKQLTLLTRNANMKIVDLKFTTTNGGSLVMVATKNENTNFNSYQFEGEIISQEQSLLSFDVWKNFSQRVEKQRRLLVDFLSSLKINGVRIAGLGASTKGGVLLQHWNLNSDYIDCIGDINSDKFNRYMAGLTVPILPESQILDDYEYFVVLPWHFKEYFLTDKKYKGKKLIFPLPEFELVEIQ